jgi:hypothetical protein
MQAIEQANQPAKPVKKSNQISSQSGDLYNPENLNDSERKVISIFESFTKLKKKYIYFQK